MKNWYLQSEKEWSTTLFGLLQKGGLVDPDDRSTGRITEEEVEEDTDHGEGAETGLSYVRDIICTLHIKPGDGFMENATKIHRAMVKIHMKKGIKGVSVVYKIITQ